MGFSLGDQLTNAAMNQESARFVEACVNAGSAQDFKLVQMGFSPPLAIEIARQINAGLGRADYLINLGMPFPQARVLAEGVGYTIVDPDAAAYVARLIVKPTIDRMKALDAFYASLKAASIYSKIDALYDWTAGAEADCLLNMKGTSFGLTRNGGVTFTPNIGAQGNGTDGYLASSFTPSTAGGQYAKDSASYGGVANAPTTRTANFLLGTTSSNSRLKARAITSDRIEGYINDGTAEGGSASSGLLPGLRSASRTGAAVKRLFNNGARVADLTTASTAITSQPLWFMRSGSNYSDEPLAFGFIGGGLADADVAAFWTALRAYLVVVSRPIFCFGDSLTWGQVGAGVQATNPWPLRLQTALRRMSYNGGIAGEISTQIGTRQALDDYGIATTTIIEAGRNNFTDPTTVKADVAAMVARCTSGKYIIVGVLPFTGDGDLTTANSITRVQLNADLAALYGNHFLDWLPSLQAANDGSANDLSDIANGWTPRSLRYDSGHPHETVNGAGASGIGVLATITQAKLAALGF